MRGPGEPEVNEDPSRLRPRSASHNALVETTRARIEKLDESEEVNARPDPIDSAQLKRAEIKARLAVGRARRQQKGAVALALALTEWGLARLARVRLVRSVNLFFFHYGTVMAAGAAYMMFFSVAAMLVAGFSVAGLVIGGNEELREFLQEAVDTALPGVLDTGDGGMATPEELFSTQGFGSTLVVSLTVMVVASLSWIHGLRSGIRSIFDRPLMAENVVLVKLRDLVIMVLLGVVLATTAGLGILTTVFIEATIEFLGWQEVATLTTRLGTIALSFMLDVLVAILLMRVASRIVIPVSALWQSALIAGVGASLLRQLSTELISGGTANPILVPFATVLGLFFYFYLFSLVYLLAASWGAVTAADHAEKS